VALAAGGCGLLFCLDRWNATWAARDGSAGQIQEL